MRWVLMLFVILAAVMGGEARAVVVTGRVAVSERVGKAETVEKWAEALRVESERASRVAVLEARKAAGFVDDGPLALWFPGGFAVARSDCGDRQAEFSGRTLSLLLARGVDIGGGTRGLLWTARRETGSAETGSTVTLRFNRYNSRGDVVGQSDAAGVTTWAATYQADGRRTGEIGTNLNPKQATGRVRELGVNRDRHRANSKEEDPTGLLNEGFRYRDMETGTFISRDPLGHVDGPNVYCYVGQNPWTKWDPEGLTGWAIPPQYAESAEYREGFRKGMAGGAKLGLALTAGAVATVVAAPVIAAGATAAGVSGGTATAATVLGSGAAGGYAGNAVSNALNDRPVNENWKTATATGALLYGAAHVVGTSVEAFKAGLNSVKSTAPSVGGTAAQTTAEVAAAAKTPASFFQSTRIEVEALQTQGLSRSEAFAQIRSFNAGNADGYLFHFTNPTNGRAIVNSGELWATQRGLGGAGVYTGTTPTPNFFQRYFSPVGWGVNPGSGVRIPLRVTPELESITRTPFLPRWTRIVGDGQSIPLSAP